MSAKPTLAAVKTWNPAGCASNSWNTGGNWTGGVPGSSDVATFNGSTSNCPVTMDTDPDVGGINIINSYTGTITQGSRNLTIEASGYVQNASGSTFSGGSGSITIANSSGVFTLTTGTFTSTTGTLTAHNNFSVNGGSFNANGGTVNLDQYGSSGNIAGTITFNNLKFGGTCNAPTSTLTSTAVVTVNGMLTLDSDGCFHHNLEQTGGGTLNAKGDITLSGSAGDFRGEAIVTINGTGDQNLIGNTASFSQSTVTGLPSVVINKPSGTLNFSNTIAINGNFTYIAGTINPGTSTVVLNRLGSTGTLDPMTITGSANFYNLYIGNTCLGNSREVDIASGTTLLVTGSYGVITNGCSVIRVNGPGGVKVTGNIDLDAATGSKNSSLGTALVTITGPGAHTITGASDSTTDGGLSGLKIDTTGSVSMSGYIGISGDFTFVQGKIVPGSSTVIINGRTNDDNQGATITGSVALNNINITGGSSGGCTGSPGITIASGTTLTAKGDLTFNENCFASSTNGPGVINVEGNISTAGVGDAGNVAITMTGGKDQTITQSGTNFPSGTLTINKTAGTVTPGASFSLSNSGQDLLISSGVLNMGNYALTVNDTITITSGQLNQSTSTLTFGTMSLGSKGIWENNSTGSIIVGSGGVTNNGYVHIDGGGPLCGDSDAITISGGGSSRPWNGTGTTSVADASVSDQSAGSVGTNGADGSSNSLVTTAFQATTGDLLIATVTWDNGSGATASISDSVGTNTWSTAVTKQTDGRHTQSMQTFYAKNINGSASMTVTFNLSVNATFRKIIVVDVANIDTSSPLDQTNHIENESGAPVSVGPVTTTANGEFIFGAVTDDSGSNTIASDAPFGPIGTATTTTSMQAQGYVQPALGSISSTWTFSGTNDALAQIATFKNNGSTPFIRGMVTAYSSTNTSNNGWLFNPGCPAYSNRSTTTINANTTINGKTTITSN